MKQYHIQGIVKPLYSIFDINRKLKGDMDSFLQFIGNTVTYKTEDYDVLILCRHFDNFMSKRYNKLQDQQKEAS